VKLDVDTLLTVPATPPVAGADRALDPAFALNPAVAVGAVLVLAEPLLEVAPTIPAAPPASTTTAAPTAMGLRSFGVSICDLLGVDLGAEDAGRLWAAAERELGRC
jgi:hypothetical protein